MSNTCCVKLLPFVQLHAFSEITVASSACKLTFLRVLLSFMRGLVLKRDSLHMHILCRRETHMALRETDSMTDVNVGTLVLFCHLASVTH